jgi:PiT family inorganic phosphate transporter
VHRRRDLNFVGAFISLEVAATVAGAFVDAHVVTPAVIFGGPIGAIAWNLATWWFGLPSSASHALIGGIVGSTFVASGSGAVLTDGILSKVLIPAIASPIVAGLIAALGVYLVYRLMRRNTSERSEREFRWAQVASSSVVALAHGTNDAQKTIGVISLALIASGHLSSGDDFAAPFWVVYICATAIALGAYSGGWRIIQALGTKVVEVRPPQGFGSEAVAATVSLASSHAGYPLSATHVVSGAVTGSGVGRPGAKVNWVVARRIVYGWLFTLPAAAAVGALVFGIIDLLGGGLVGVAAVSAIALIAAYSLWKASKAQAVEPDETISENPAFGPGAHVEAAA